VAGTVFPLTQLITTVNTSSGATSNYTPAGTPTLTYTGTQTINGVAVPVYNLNVPGLSLTGANSLPANGQTTTVNGVSSGWLLLTNLNYTTAGFWSLGASDNPNAFYDGEVVAGFQTPTANVPTTGTGTYIGIPSPPGSSTAGGVTGVVFYNGLNRTMSGRANIGVNFGSGAVTGSLTGIIVGNISGSQSYWNDVSLDGTLSGATISGTATAGAPPTPSYGTDPQSPMLPTGAHGTFTGALYGPNGQELGATWSLSDAASGKSAIGTVTATKQ